MLLMASAILASVDFLALGSLTSFHDVWACFFSLRELVSDCMVEVDS